MLGKAIAFFVDRHILANLLFLIVLGAGYWCWENMGKEEMPEFAFNRVSISVSYPGATAEEVERLVIRPLEKAMLSLDGIEEIRSSASSGAASVSVTIQHNAPNFQELVTEIRSAALGARLPEEIIEEPRIRQFKSSTKAIIDIAVFDTTLHLLNEKQRRKLQATALSLENDLLQLDEVHSVNRRGFLREEIRIQADPKQLLAYNIPLNALASEIRNNNQRRPAGSMDDGDETKVTVSGELNTVSALKKIIVQGGFEGPVVRLGDVARIDSTFEKNTSIQKVNGHEAVILNVVKHGDVGILKAVEAVTKRVHRYESLNLKDKPTRLLLLDDESLDVRNRLSLISSNGLIGIVLILTLLFLFLNFRSGLWVAVGIPFCFGFTLIGATLLGYTINNMTLAAVIIVMGMLVDDAIVVAENIARMEKQGTHRRTAAIEGARFMGLPVTAAVVTTCMAFLPLLFFQDRFGNLIKVIPPIITLMLAASLIESLLILPGHMTWSLPRPVRWVLSLGTLRLWERRKLDRHKPKKHWFDYLEDLYGFILRQVLRVKIVLFLAFAFLLYSAYKTFTGEMKFVLFPNEETTQVRVNLEAPAETDRFRMAELSRQVEDILKPYMGKEMVGFRTEVARSRRGRPVEENVASMRVEVVPKAKREMPVGELVGAWETEAKKVDGLTKVRFSTTRFGQESGNAIEIRILENNDKSREAVADSLAIALKKHPALENVEIDRPLRNAEYLILLNRERIKRLGINPASISQTLRTILEGSVLYELIGDQEEIYVVLSAQKHFTRHIGQILSLPVENRGNYLVPLSEVVSFVKTESPASLERVRSKRIATVFADLKQGTETTPLEIADELEETVFPGILSRHTTANLEFAGEVADSRKTQSEFTVSIIAVILLIFGVLAVLYGSLLWPVVIMLSIPFSVVGVVYAFKFHGMLHYGFFGVVGVLGMMGVVINDSIVMLVKLRESKWDCLPKEVDGMVAAASKTRLRAVLLTTLTTVAGLFPTAYGVAGYDAMLTEMMLAMGWGLIFGTTITLLLVPSLFSFLIKTSLRIRPGKKA